MFARVCWRGVDEGNVEGGLRPEEHTGNRAKEVCESGLESRTCFRTRACVKAVAQSASGRL